MPGKGDSITTKFKVDISDLKKGITEANQNIKLANAEFKAASAGMDNWAKSSEGINAKLKQLSSVLTEQKTKLESYKKQQQEIDKAYDENGKRADELRAKMALLASQGVSKTSEEYKKYEKALNDVEKEQIANKKASDNLKVTIANQQAVVNKTEKEMKDYEASLKDVEKAEKIAAKTGKSVEDALKDIAKEAEKTESKVGELANKMAGGLQKGLTVIGTAATGFIAALVASSTASQEFTEDMGKLETAFTTSGHSVDTAKNAYHDFVGILGETDQSVEAVNHLAKLTQNEEELAKWTDIAAGVYGTFGDSLPLEGLTEAANETARVGQVTGPLADALNWAGVSEDEFNEKLAACTSEQERATLITETLSGLYKEAGDTYQEVNGDLIDARQATSDLAEANAEMGQIITPIVTAVKEAFAGFLDDITPKIKEFVDNVDWEEFGQTVEDALGKVADGFEWLIDHKDVVIAAISGMVAAFAAAKIASFVTAMTGAINAIKGAAAAQGLFNAVMNANPIGVVITIIGLLVAAIVLLIQNWDAVKEAAEKCWTGIENAVSGAWEAITGVFSGIADWFSEKFSDARSKTEEAWSDVKEWASNTWDNIKEGFFGIADWFSEKFSDARSKTEEAWSDVKEWASNTWGEIKDGFFGVGDWFEETFEDAWKRVKGVFSDWGSFFGGLWATIRNKFSSIGTHISDAIGGAVKAGINGVISSIESIINKAIGIINGAIDLINKIPGVNVKKVSTVSFPRLEKGGILKKGQVGLLEGSGAEAVVPLERNKYWIKSVAKEMQRQLAADVNSARNAASAINNSNVNNFTQVINAPKSPSRIELYRQTKNLLALKGV